MAKYTKFNSNYIRRDTHQYLKGGSTIFERDWMTIGGRLRFGPDKTTLFGDSNFVFTTSKLPNYKKKHRLGTTVGEWTYDDVKDAKKDVNKIQIGQKINDIRNMAYYGSSVELLRSSVEHIISTFPGNVTADTIKIRVPNSDGTSMVESNYVEIVNDFGYDLVNESLSGNSYKFLKNSAKSNFLLNGYEIENYDVISRNLYEKIDECYQNVKETPTGASVTVNNITSKTFICEDKILAANVEYVDCSGITKTTDSAGTYKVQTNQISIMTAKTFKLKNYEGLDGFNGTPVYVIVKANGHVVSGSSTITSTKCHMSGDTPIYTIKNTNSVKVRYTPSSNTLTIYFEDTRTHEIHTETFIFDESEVNSISVRFYTEGSVKKTYKYLQFVDNTNSEEKGRVVSWVNSNCPPQYWLRNTGFTKVCDSDHYMSGTQDKWNYIRYSYLFWGDTSETSVNHPIYEITVQNKNNETLKIYAYIVNGKITYLTNYSETPFVISPKKELMNAYFNTLDTFEKILLNRETKPLYTSLFVTPNKNEEDETILYKPETYTWPSDSNGCISISSNVYFEYLNSITSMAENMDELCTDNIWRRMTHEAIRNYDWTYTREFVDGDEEENVAGGERMQKVIRIIGRVFDDVKQYIDSMRHVNRITYSGYDDVPDAMLSDKLKDDGWETFTTIPILEVPQVVENSNQNTEVGGTEVHNDDNENNSGVIGGRRSLRGENEQEIVYVDTDMGDVTMESEEAMRDFIINKEENENVWYPSLNVENLNPLTVDNSFMRKFVLMSNRIFATKGTIQSIDMVMGMFGYGEDDYKISEHYRTVTPRDYDEKLDETDENSETFGNTIVKINDEKRIEKYYDEDTSGIPVGSFINKGKTFLIPYYNIEKFYDGDLYYQQNGGWYSDLTKHPIYKYLQIDNDPTNEDLLKVLSYFMVKLLYSTNHEFWGESLVVTYDRFENNYWYYEAKIDNADYDNMTISKFRTNGENLYYTLTSYENDEEKRVTCFNDFGWNETLSYLHVVSDVGSLLSINPYKLKFGDIYYVYNVSDYFSYKTEEDNSELHSNFFAVVDDYNPELLGSWKNIDMSDPNDEFYEKANYINNLVSINTGNNPHVGFGFYDKGEGFFDYMKKPFKYALDNNYINVEDIDKANLIKFDISDDIEVPANPTEIDRLAKAPTKSTVGSHYYNTTNNKLYKCTAVSSDGDATWEEDEEMVYDLKTKIFHDEKEFTDVNTYVIDDNTETMSEYSGGELTHNEHLYRTYDIDSMKDKRETTYYLNSKYIIFENKLSEKEGTEYNYFKEYFKEVIMKYVMQVIPSSTILLLKNFE